LLPDVLPHIGLLSWNRFWRIQITIVFPNIPVGDTQAQCVCPPNVNIATAGLHLGQLKDYFDIGNEDFLPSFQALSQGGGQG
jgi:hypothetical protein